MYECIWFICCSEKKELVGGILVPGWRVFASMQFHWGWSYNCFNSIIFSPFFSIIKDGNNCLLFSSFSLQSVLTSQYIGENSAPRGWNLL